MAMQPEARHLQPRRYRVVHRTTYRYDQAVTACYERGLLTVRECPSQTVVESGYTVTPEAGVASCHTDLFGNPSWYLEVLTPHTTLEVVKEAVVDVEWPALEDDVLNAWTVGQVREELADSPRFRELRALYGLPSPLAAHTEAVAEFAAGLVDDRAGFGDMLTALTEGIWRDFSYRQGVTTVRTTLDQVLELRAGVCQDFAHLALACLRLHGLAARYVSGYIETAPPPGKPKLQGSDASHAWVSVLLPDGRWVDIDPTNAHYADSRYVVNAWGRDFGDVSPLKGVIYTEATDSSLSVGVDVIRLD